MSSRNRKNKRGQRGTVEEEVSVAKKSKMADSTEEETETNLEGIKEMLVGIQNTISMLLTHFLKKGKSPGNEVASNGELES